MNTILPRINQHRGKAIVNFGNHPMVLVRGNNSVLPRLGGGVPAKVVLANSGIKRGPLVKVSGWDADAKRREKEAQEKLEAAKREAEKRAEEKRLAEERAKAEAERRERAEAERRAAEAVKPLTETEERLADFLEAAQDVKPIVDDVAEEQANATEPYDDPEYMKEQVVEEKLMPQPEPLQEEIVERAAVIPEGKKEEWVQPEQPRKKKRGRKGKRARAETMAMEQGLL